MAFLNPSRMCSRSSALRNSKRVRREHDVAAMIEEEAQQFDQPHLLRLAAG